MVEMMEMSELGVMFRFSTRQCSYGLPSMDARITTLAATKAMLRIAARASSDHDQSHSLKERFGSVDVDAFERRGSSIDGRGVNCDQTLSLVPVECPAVLPRWSPWHVSRREL